MAHFESQANKRSVDAAVNIVPFIDLMSSLTAFLLVAAVWQADAQLNVTADQRGPSDVINCFNDRISVLVDGEGIHVGHSRTNEVTNLAAGDWSGLSRALRDVKAVPEMSDATDIRVAINSTAAAPLDYQAMIAASDTAIAAGFRDIEVIDPGMLPGPFGSYQ